MELHEDDPDHFEFFLKFIYTNEYDKHEIAKLAGDDKGKRVLVPIGVHAIADKYDVAKLYKPAAEDVKAVLLEAVEEEDMLITAIQAHYGTEVNVDGAMGRLITDVVFDKHQGLLEIERFEQLLLAHSNFAADVALHSHRGKGLRTPKLAQCLHCKKQVVSIDHARKAGMRSFYCPNCRLQNDHLFP